MSSEKLTKKVKNHIIDQGLGNDYDEVEKYINRQAFLAEEFLDKYKDSAKDSGIIGHFVLVLLCFYGS
jgi:molecular chaperone HtpG